MHLNTKHCCAGKCRPTINIIRQGPKIDTSWAKLALSLKPTYLTSKVKYVRTVFIELQLVTILLTNVENLFKGDSLYNRLCSPRYVSIVFLPCYVAAGLQADCLKDNVSRRSETQREGDDTLLNENVNELFSLHHVNRIPGKLKISRTRGSQIEGWKLLLSNQSFSNEPVSNVVVEQFREHAISVGLAMMNAYKIMRLFVI